MDVQLLKKTFEMAKPISIDIVTKMYELLFEKHPEAKPLFEKTDFSKQKKVLANSIGFIVENVEDSERLTKYLHKMGARHIDYGTEPEYYPWVGEALIGALSFYMGEDWTPEIEDTWTQAYQFIATTMIEGAQSDEVHTYTHDSSQTSETTKDTNVVEIKVEHVANSFDFELSNETKKAIEMHARSIFEDKIKEEFERCFEQLKSEYTEEKIHDLLKSA
jgi:hemoglobin-like flavoprotein